MAMQSLTAQQRSLLEARHLHPPFPSAAATDLLDVLQAAHVDTGAALMRQGEPGDALYLVLAGRLAVQVVTAHGGEPRLVNVVNAGEVVGELALLTGQPRNASVVALEPVEAARLPREDFETLAARYPQALALFLQRVLPRLRGTQLVGILSEVFGPLDTAAQAELGARLVWRQLAGGERLFAQGDASDDVYIVVNGRLRASVANGGADGATRAVEEVGRGQVVGEVGLLTGEARVATVTAVRDSDVLALSRASFEALLDHQPRSMLAIARGAARRLRQSVLSTQRAPGPTAFALLAGGDPRLLPSLARSLAAGLATLVEDPEQVLVLDSRTVDERLARPGIAQTGSDGPLHASLVAWMAALEREHTYVVLCGDADDTPWTRRCLRAADRVVVVAGAADPPQLRAAESAARERHPFARFELVLVHDDSASQPRGTLPWLTPRPFAAHHHVRLGRAQDVHRLARCLAGRAHALVLGGGGARGFVHLGALRALAEAGIAIDMIGGTSIGAVIAGASALGLRPDDMGELARSFASRRKLLDRTLPLVALTEGAKLTAIYRGVFGETAIEDLWLPYFAVSSGLSRAEAVLHTRGALWLAARATTAVPAIFPPIVTDDQEVLVDGNVMNNMPLDVMRSRCEGGTLIGVNPMPPIVKPRTYTCGPSVSGWKALAGRLRLFGVKLRAPNLFGAVMRATEINSANRMRQPAFRALADLLIEPPVGDYPIMGYGAWEPIMAIGYEATKAAITAWPQASAHRRDHVSVDGTPGRS